MLVFGGILSKTGKDGLILRLICKKRNVKNIASK